MARPEFLPDGHICEAEGVAAETEDDSRGVLAQLFGLGVAADLDQSDHQ